MKKKVIAMILIFVMLFGGLFLCFSRIYGVKTSYGINQMAKIYDLPKDSVDVVFLGTSHVWSDFQPALMWEEYGIAAYDLCAARQPIWHSYYYLKDMMKSQSPKVVVLDTFSLSFEWDVDPREEDLVNSLYGMRFSLDKIKNVMEFYPKGYRLQYIFEYIQYHKRYNLLTHNDFKSITNTLYNGDDLLGGHTNFEVMELEDPTDHYMEYDQERRDEIWPKEMEYFEKLIELCRNNGATLVLIDSPSAEYNERAFAVDNYIAKFADDNGIDFYNYATKSREIGMDWSSEFMDAAHMNYWGGQKYTRYVAENVLSKYALINHKEDGSISDNKYDYWNYCAREYKNVYSNHVLNSVETVEALLSQVDGNDGYIIAARMTNASVYETSDEVQHFVDKYGIDLNASNPNSVWIIQGDSVEYLTEGYKNLSFPMHELKIFSDVNRIYLDGVLYEDFADGLTLTVFEAVTGDFVCQMNYCYHRNGKE